LTALNQGSFSVHGVVPNVISIESLPASTIADSHAITFTDTASVAYELSAGNTTPYVDAILLLNKGGLGVDGMDSHSSYAKPTSSGVSAPITATITDTGISTDNSASGGNTTTSGMRLVTQSFNAGSAVSNQDKVNGATANPAGPITLNVTGSSVTAMANNSTIGGAIVSQQFGGSGGLGWSNAAGGHGGDVGLQTTNLLNATLHGEGNNISGLLIQQFGGDGGDGHSTSPRANGGAGGAGAGTPDSNNVLLQLQSGALNTVESTGNNAPAIRIDVIAGKGGTGSDDYGFSANGGSGGGGGTWLYDASKLPSQAVTVQSDGNQDIETSGNNAPGIQTTVRGGDGGASMPISNVAGSETGDGGLGGAAGATTISLGTGAVITTSGDNASAIDASGIGGNGGLAGLDHGTSSGTSGSGGRGGIGGRVDIELASAVTLSTSGANSNGVLAQSLGGDGGIGQKAQGVFDAHAGNGGRGGDSGDIFVNSHATITTVGASARGIFAQGHAGSGGVGGNADGVFGDGAGNGGQSGAVATISVNNAGSITTSGDGAHGIQAMSLGGTGGAGGTGYAFFPDSGDGGVPTASGGPLSITNTGDITTYGTYADGILAQSIGGGGGDAGAAHGITSSTAGDAGAGGNGAAIAGALNGSITTGGGLSNGAVFQSVGGTGGSGGNARSDGVVAAYALGGDGGKGGDGGTITVSGQGGRIVATGSGSGGIVMQSVGGGGGVGGEATAVSGSILVSLASAVGGSGGDGGAGNTVSTAMGDMSISTGQQNAETVDAVGILAQSIGGGGGAGGGADALAFAATLKLTDEIQVPTVTATYSAGGSGGDGGKGGDVDLNLGIGSVRISDTQTINTTGGASISTAGSGSTGIIAQSVGGGGGQGGDSSSLAAVVGAPSLYGKAEISPPTTFELSVSVGGVGAVGGDGGAVTTNLSSANAPVLINTSGDYAYGLIAQSIGGGGGNAGSGSADTKTIGSTSNSDLKISVGHEGGGGGNGGAVQVDLNTGTSIETLGSAAVGVLAQSTGGGGGTSTGSTISSSLFSDIANSVVDSVSPGSTSHIGNVTLNVGSADGAAGDGGSVVVNNHGTITTNGNDAPAVLAQSIGGGGGVGGSAGIDPSLTGDAGATDGTPVITATTLAANIVSDGFESAFKSAINDKTQDINLMLQVGAGGAVSGNGGSVTLDHGGSLVTSGDYSPGIVAQSIGAGGGRGGTAIAGGEGNAFAGLVGAATITSHVFLGNTYAGSGGGGGGAGGAVSVTLDGGATILTGVGKGLGFQSIGLLAQSIGGGGGTGADGTVAPNSIIFLGDGLYGSTTGALPVGGDGGVVTLNQGAPGATVITTSGVAADGILLQSVGGGGGLAGAGSTVMGNLDINGLPNTVGVNFGTVSQQRHGGDVFVNQPQVQITTSGRDAVGLMAQSIGGGGGVVNVTGSSNVVLGFTNGNGGVGGDVKVILPNGASIDTSGIAADGIVAQSVGGGGGFLTGQSGTMVPDVTYAVPDTLYRSASGPGGMVFVSLSTPVITTGDGAYGVLAQSIANGGGIFALSTGQTFIGSTSNSLSDTQQQAAGAVTVEAGQGIQATGRNAVAIFAQSVGNTVGQHGGTITVRTSAEVMGGSGAQGAGIVIDGGTSSNLITIRDRSSVSAGLSAPGGRQDPAIRVDRGIANVNNAGTIYGDVYLGGGAFSGNHPAVEAQTTATPSVLVVPTAGGTLYNDGSIVAVPGQQSVVDGNLVQRSSGRIVTTADFAAGKISSYVVSGDATLAGYVQPTLVSILPNVRLPVLTVQGTTTGRLTALSSALFSYQVTQTGNEQYLSVAGRNFDQSQFDLTPTRAAIARGLGTLFDAGHVQLGTFFAALDTEAGSSPAGYGRILSQLGPRSVGTVGARRAFDAARIADQSMNCPVSADGSSALVEQACIYGRTSGGNTADSGDTDRGRMQLGNVVFQGGGQTRLNNNMFVGGSVAYERSWYNSSTDSVKGNGNAGQGAITFKWQPNRWLLTGAAFGSVGDFHISRDVNVAAIGGIGSGSTDMESVGLRLRAAYTFGSDPFYIRPYFNIDGIYARSGGYHEKGLGLVGLQYGATDQTTAVFTPAVETGSRLKIGSKILGAFVFGGASVRSNDTWKLPARLEGTVSRHEDFRVRISQDRAVAHVGGGLQLFQSQRLDIRLQYDGIFGNLTTSHEGSLAAIWRL